MNKPFVNNFSLNNEDGFVDVNLAIEEPNAGASSNCIPKPPGPSTRRRLELMMEEKRLRNELEDY